MRLIFRASSAEAANRTATALNEEGVQAKLSISNSLHTLAIDCRDDDAVLAAIRRVLDLDPAARPFS